MSALPPAPPPDRPGRPVRRRVALSALPCAVSLLLVGCGAKRAPLSLALDPAPSSTSATSAPPTTYAPAPWRTTTTARAATARAAAAVPTTATGTPSASVNPSAASASDSSSSGRGISVKVPATATAAASAGSGSGSGGAKPATAATSPKATSAATTGASKPATTTSTIVLAPAPLQLTVPSSRTVPDGPFEVLVAGASSFDLAAEPAAVCRVDGGRIVPLAAGDCLVRASAPERSPAAATVALRRGDPAITWQFGPTTSFTYNTTRLDLRATSGAAVTATAATGACRLDGAGALSFVPASGAPRIGTCTVTATVPASVAWNAARADLTVDTTFAPVTVAFDTPASVASAPFTVRAVMTQADRSLDTRLAFSVMASGGCALNATPATPDAATRTATVKLIGSAPASQWCALRLVPRGGEAAAVVALSGATCRWVWIGTGTPSATKPACPS